ncbi:hypothetical protein MOTE_19130 [Moorella thermoacetica]|uniref:Uncharacterized protein n=1 Tax=Neomoorella thermoacetica TaxID=1525 RepID=A0A1J5NRV7_NEOTH|nr:hypothetical protein MOTE_19130 [Moorella thermoacetica]
MELNLLLHEPVFLLEILSIIDFTPLNIILVQRLFMNIAKNTIKLLLKHLSRSCVNPRARRVPAFI